MKTAIKRILLTTLIVTHIVSVQPVTLSRTTAVGGALVGGVASGAVGYGTFIILEKIYDKSRKTIKLSAQDRMQNRMIDKQILEQVGQELAQEDQDDQSDIEETLNTTQKHGRSMKRKVLASVFVVTLGVLGGGLTFQFLDGYTNEGRLKYTEKILAKIETDEIIALIGDNQDWHENDAVLNKIYIKFGSKAPMTGLKKHVDRLLSQVTKAGKGLKAIHDDKSNDLDNNTGIDALDEKTEEKLTTLREASNVLATSPTIEVEAQAHREAAEERSRTISNVRKAAYVARDAAQLGRKYLA